MPLQELAKVIAQVADRRSDAVPKKSSIESAKREDVGGIPKVITFPYSRHSSYEELCHLVEIFRPRDVYPCTVDGDNWDEGMFICRIGVPPARCGSSCFSFERVTHGRLEISRVTLILFLYRY
jgi:hypothetical protein